MDIFKNIFRDNFRDNAGIVGRKKEDKIVKKTLFMLIQDLFHLKYRVFKHAKSQVNPLILYKKNYLYIKTSSLIIMFRPLYLNHIT